MCRLGTHTRGWEHGFATRIGVRISAHHIRTGLSTEPPSYGAFDENLELKQDTETAGLPLLPGQGTKSCWEPGQMGAP